MKYRCPKCGFDHSEQDWDHATSKLCLNRELKRKYVPIAKSKGKSLYYVCPNCLGRIRAEYIKDVDKLNIPVNDFVEGIGASK